VTTLADQSFAEQLDPALSARAEPGFVRALRDAGRETFLREKLPTQKHEDWRYTNLAPLTGQPWVAAPRGSAPADAGELPPAPRLVFSNGRLDPALTDLSGLSPGVTAGSLAAALRERPGALEPLLASRAASAHPFAALNAALFEDGAFVEIAEGAQVERPLHVVHLSGALGVAAALHPRNLLVAGRGARAAIAESYRGVGRYLVNAVTDVALGEGAHLDHAHVQEDAGEAFHLAVVRVEGGARSRYAGRSVALGAALARVESRAVLCGEGASCDLDGLYVGNGRQLLDHLVLVDHASPGCTSRQLFKGILDDHARGVFAGRILVREGAQKTDATQSNSNLLLSDDASIDTKPQLEILNDDVKCSHGGTVGQLREDHLFYLRSRGIPEKLARALLTWAFASEMVQRVGSPDVRARVRAAVTARLPGGVLLTEAA
jgi:Fe-S cluster assembly protein SufD